MHSGDDNSINKGNPGERKVIKLVQRSLAKTVAGRRLRFVEPSAGDEARLAEVFAAGDARRYVNELLAVCVVEPQLTPAEVAALPETARARARVAVAEVAGVSDDYRRLKGDGDSRLHEAMRIRNERLAAELKAIGAAVNDSILRLARDAQRTLNQLGGSDAIARLAETAMSAQRDAVKIMGPIADAISQANRAVEQMRPALDWLDQNRRLFAENAGVQQRLGENLARRIEPFVRPAYFGAIADMRRQAELVRPRYAETIAKSLAGMNDALVPRLSGIAALNRTIELPALRQINEAVEALRRTIVPDVTRLIDSLAEGLRRQIAVAAQAYAAWLERHWPEVYANPDHPAPVLFLIASLPMSIGLPIYEAVEEAKRDEELLDGLERALQGASLLAQIEAAVQTSSELDPIAKRRLVVALEAVGEGHYIDAAPDLSQGLERAFILLARRRGIVDDNNKFLIPARTARAKKVEDLFEHLALDYGYRRYLNSWVFGDFGNPARHGTLPDEAAHRRWVLRAVAALLGWFQYCAGDEQPMRQLVARLELALDDVDAQAS